MKRIITALALTTGLVLGMAGPADAAKRDTLTVMGDSISAWYNDKPGDASQAWWSMLARNERMNANVSAIGGTGMINKGPGCGYSTYSQRMKDIKKSTDTLYIEGGRNDFHLCGDVLTKRQIKSGIAKYFKSLDKTVKKYRIKDVKVVTIWGSKFKNHRDRVVPFVKRYAERYGYDFKLINLKRSETTDGTHPNRRGSVKIYKNVRKMK